MITVSPMFGNMESTCFHYGSFVDAELLKEVDISPGLVRFSVGLEDVDDIINDISQAIKNTYTYFENM